MKTVKYILIAILFILGLSMHSYGDVTNDVAKAVKGTMYSAKASTPVEAEANQAGKNALNCIEYAFRIKSVAKDAEIWQTSDNHAIVIVKDEKGKRIAYSNGKKVKESSYSKIHRIR